MTVAETLTVEGAQATPELIALLDEAAEAATTLRDRAVAACLGQGVLRRQARQCRARARAARRPRPGLDRHLCRGAAPACQLCPAHRWRGPVRRDGKPARPDRRGRASRPTCRRRDDEPGRDGAPARAWRQRGGPDGFSHPGGACADRGRDARDACAGRDADSRRASRRCRQFRRPRTRGDLRGHSQRDAPVLGSEGRAACPGLAPQGRVHSASADQPDGGARRVLAHAAGGVWRARPRQGGDVRRLRGTIARLYRCRLARHALRDRRGADPEWRHRPAEAGMAAQDRLRRNSADGGVHRAQYRFGPRLAHHPRGEGRRCLSHHRPEDLDHPRRPRRPDDRAGPHRP